MTRRLILIVVLLFVAFSHHALAGGGYSAAELRKMRWKCNNQVSGFSCETLAEETMCGVGYNAETSKWMQRACDAHKQQCKKRNMRGCKQYVACLTGCIPDSDTDRYTYNDTSLGGCHLVQSNGKQIKAYQAKRRAVRLLKYLCQKNNGDACTTTGDLTNANQSTHWAWYQKGCDLGDAIGCAKASEELKKKAESNKYKLCALVEKEQADIPSRYKNMCNK